MPSSVQNESDSYRYDYVLDLNQESTASKLLRLVGRNKHVLELGCATGSMTRILKEKLACRVTGVELDPVSAARAEPYCDTLFVGNLDHFDWTLLSSQTFDVILIADVLEHLRNPEDCLKQLRLLLKPSGYLLISVPNIAYNGIIASLLLDDFPYAEIGLLDRTHIHFFTWKTLEKTLNHALFSIVSQEMIIPVPEHPEFYAYWHALPLSLQHYLAQNPHGQVYQYIVQAIPEDAPKQFIPPEKKTQTTWLETFQAQQNAFLQAQQELEQMRRSHSWKITAPLRAFGRLLQFAKSIISK